MANRPCASVRSEFPFTPPWLRQTTSTSTPVPGAGSALHAPLDDRVLGEREVQLHDLLAEGHHRYRFCALRLNSENKPIVLHLGFAQFWYAFAPGFFLDDISTSFSLIKFKAIRHLGPTRCASSIETHAPRCMADSADGDETPARRVLPPGGTCHPNDGPGCEAYLLLVTEAYSPASCLGLFLQDTFLCRQVLECAVLLATAVKPLGALDTSNRVHSPIDLCGTPLASSRSGGVAEVRG